MTFVETHSTILTLDIPLFEGDAHSTIGAVGVSGALAKEDFLRTLMGDTVSAHNSSMLAGMMDTIAAQAIVDSFGRKSSSFAIPERAGNLSRSH